MIVGGAGAAPVPSHASVAVSPRPKPQSHWGGTRARRTPVPGSPARAPATRGRTAGGSRTTARSRSDGDIAGRTALGPRARPARALRERRGRDLPRPRAALGQGHEFAYPMYPSRHFRPVREYQYVVSFIRYFGLKCRNRRGRDLPRPRAALGQGHEFAYPMYPSRHFRPVREYQYVVSFIRYFGLKCRNPADGRSGCVYRTDRNGSIASGGPRSDPTGQGRTPPDAGQRPGRGRPGRLPAGKPSPRCMRRRRTGSRARCGRCSPTTGVPRRLREFAGVADGRRRRRDGAPRGCARHDEA